MGTKHAHSAQNIDVGKIPLDINNFLKKLKLQYKACSLIKMKTTTTTNKT